MKFKNFEEFKEWFENVTRDLEANRILNDVVINLDVFGPKKNIVDDVEFSIKGNYTNDIIKSVYENAVDHDQKLIEVYIEKLKTGSYKDYKVTIGCLIGFITCIYNNYFILEVASNK